MTILCEVIQNQKFLREGKVQVLLKTGFAIKLKKVQGPEQEIQQSSTGLHLLKDLGALDG